MTNRHAPTALEAAARELLEVLTPPGSSDLLGAELEALDALAAALELEPEPARTAGTPTALEAAQADAIRELYGFMVTELDPDPAPIGDYITDPTAALAAELAVGADNLEPEVAEVILEVDTEHYEAQVADAGAELASSTLLEPDVEGYRGAIADEWDGSTVTDEHPF